MTEAAAAQAAAMNAIKASGTLIRVTPEVFLRLVNKQDEPLVVTARGGLFQARWQYLAPYRGLAFFAGSPEPLPLPGRAEVLAASKIWLPG